MEAIPRFTVAAAAIGGTAWIIKTVTITVRDAYFEPLESVIFFVGLVGIVSALVSLGWHLAAGRSVLVRVAASLGVLIAVIAVASLIAAFVGSLYNGSNIGLEGEVPLFVMGVVAVVFAVVAARDSRQRASS